MRHLVLGGAGFIGSHLCDVLLRDGHEVVCLDNLFTGTRANALRPDEPRFEFVRHDVCDPFHIEANVVWNLACPASPVHYARNPVRTIRTAVQGTLNALECARNTGARLVITSTSEVYGDPTVHPQPESYWGNVNPVGPRACYDEGKRCGEALATSWRTQYGTDVRIARLFNTYGPRMASNDGRLLPNLITQALRGEPLTVYGDGSQTRSFCYVTDTVDALVRLGEVPASEETEVVNIGNPDERTIYSVAEDVIRATGGRGRIEFRPLPEDDPRQRRPDISRARAVLGWEPCVGYVAGIRMTVGWFRGTREVAA